MIEQTIQEIKLEFEQSIELRETLAQHHLDSRKGVQQLIRRYEKKLVQETEMMARFEKMNQHEKYFRNRNMKSIAGVDEAGRGPLAGPVVAAAVILPVNCSIYELDDSKKLSASLRKNLEKRIKLEAVGFQIEWIHASEIDDINILNATKKAMNSTINNMSEPVDHILIDAVYLNEQSISQTNLIQGDSKSISIAAASILAKEARDLYMDELHEVYPQYGFNRHKGYGTKDHIEAIKKYGPIEEHRKTFAPITQYIK